MNPQQNSVFSEGKPIVRWLVFIWRHIFDVASNLFQIDQYLGREISNVLFDDYKRSYEKKRM